jgi:hypothetical protein
LTKTIIQLTQIELLELKWLEVEELHLKKGGSAYHTTKDGRRVKKGLYYYMNKRKKAGTSRPGKGTVSTKALKRSAKTAKK